jgi:hypothetical protein
VSLNLGGREGERERGREIFDLWGYGGGVVGVALNIFSLDTVTPLYLFIYLFLFV